MEKDTTKTKDKQLTTTRARILTGQVIKTAMQDTITVAVESYVQHPKYRKYMKRTKKYLVHDQGNTAVVGQKVRIQETTPISKRKHFRLVGQPAATKAV